MTAAPPAARPDMRCPATRADFARLQPIPTRWLDNDAYGHVNNALYYAWFDTVVNATLIEAGLLDLANGPTIFLVIASGCTYLRPVSFPVTVEAGLRIGRLGRSSIRWEIGIFTPDHAAPAAEGHFIHVHVNRASRQPVAIGADTRRVLEPMVRPQQ